MKISGWLAIACGILLIICLVMARSFYITKKELKTSETNMAKLKEKNSELQEGWDVEIKNGEDRINQGIKQMNEKTKKIEDLKKEVTKRDVRIEEKTKEYNDLKASHARPEEMLKKCEDLNVEKDQQILDLKKSSKEWEDKFSLSEKNSKEKDDIISSWSKKYYAEKGLRESCEDLNKDYKKMINSAKLKCMLGTIGGSVAGFTLGMLLGK